MMNHLSLSSIILNKAYELGADCAGIANVKDLKTAPAFVMMPKRPHIDRVGAVPYETGLPEGEVKWPEGIHSVLVIAVVHSESEPYKDSWLDNKNPPGNMRLIEINRNIHRFLEESYPEIRSIPLNYYVEKGGVWLKDSAAVAGLGVIGKNNLLVTPRFGPRVRLRAMFLSADLPSTGPLQWDPCEGCSMPCRAACPQKAFAQKVYDPKDYDGLEQLPARDGVYRLQTCDIQMKKDEDNEDTSGVYVEGYGKTESVITYCRKCELNCVVGRGV